MSSPPRWLEALLLVALFTAVALGVRWPVSVYIDAIQLDPNTPLHVLVARELTGGGSATMLSVFEFPDGIPVRLIAWPILLFAVPLNLVLAPIPAMNVALVVWVSLQGIAVASLGRALGWSRIGVIVAGISAQLAPMALLALGNGQFENVAYLELAAVVWAGRRGGWAGFIVGALALLAASFSSPYQGLVAGILLGLVCLLTERRRVLLAVGAGAVAYPLVFAYFAAVSSGELHLYVSPAPPDRHEQAALVELVTPRVHRSGVLFDVAGPGERLARAGRTPYRQAYDFYWMFEGPSVASYLGLGLIVLGVPGLWRRRSDPVIRGVAAAGGICLVMALGTHLSLSTLHRTGIPMPWWLSQHLPGVSGMQATLRFLSGATFALIVGVGCMLDGRRWWMAPPAVLVLMIDGLLLAPVHWPVKALEPHLDSIAPYLTGAPVAVWPSAPAIAPQGITLFVLLIDRPVAMFTGAAGQEDGGEVPGRVAAAHTVNRLGESPEAWLERVRAAGVRQFLQFEGIPQPLQQTILPGEGTCAQGFCVWDLPD